MPDTPDDKIVVPKVEIVYLVDCVTCAYCEIFSTQQKAGQAAVAHARNNRHKVLYHRTKDIDAT